MYTVVASSDPKKIIQKDISPQNYVLTFAYEDAQTRLEIHNEAVKLAEHMTVINESRKLIGKGDTVTWDEFISNEDK